MKIALVVTARLGSSRLRRKHLLPVNGRPIIHYLLERISNEFRAEMAAGEAFLVIATSDESENREFEQFAGSDVAIFYGPLENIPLRVLQAAQSHGADAVLLVEGDDILCSLKAMRLVYLELKQHAKYVHTSGLPFGLNCMGFSREFLAESLVAHPGETLDTGWSRIFDDSALKIVEVPEVPAESFLRFSLDYPEDYEFFKEIIQLLKRHIYTATDYEIVNLVKRESLYRTNMSRVQEYWDNFNKGKEKETRTDAETESRGYRSTP